MVKGTPNREIVVQASGPEMGYVTTPICAIASAKMFLGSTKDRIPYGVLTPASAFSNVTEQYFASLKADGVEFSVVSKRDLE